MKVGEYCRTETGQIGKITYFEGDMVRVDCDKFITYKSNHNEITKISPNIIDLIEVGDYINGEKVGRTIDTNELAIINTGLIYDKSFNLLKEIDIKSIVTKEQFKSMEYKVKE